MAAKGVAKKRPASFAAAIKRKLATAKKAMKKAPPPMAKAKPKPKAKPLGKLAKAAAKKRAQLVAEKKAAAGPPVVQSLAPKKASKELQALLNDHLLESLYKQYHLADIVGESAWSLSLEDGPEMGKLCFGDKMVLDCQVLGSESYVSNTFRWAWANPHIPSKVTKSAMLLKEGKALWGKTTPPPEFTHANVPLSAATGHSIAAIACGLLKGHAYYRAPTGEKGAAILLITDRKFPKRVPDTLADADRLTKVIEQGLAIGTITTPNKSVDGFLRKHGGKPGAGSTYNLPGGAKITAQFDFHGRVQRLACNESVSARTARAKARPMR